MPPRTPTACRTIRRQGQARSSTDSVWISDDLLLGTLQQFTAGSRQHRRHGSFVPGPLECRRRLGKRRMAYASDPMPPLFGNRDLGGFLGSMEELSWRWRPPSTALERAESSDIVIRLPKWLSRWVLGPDTTPDIAAALEPQELPLPKDIKLTRERLLEFREAILRSRGSPEEITARFVQYMRQSLTVGAVEETVLCEAMNLVSETINLAFHDDVSAMSERLAFYEAIWDGISACKIVRLDDFHASTMDRLLALISELPISAQSRNLIQRLLNGMSRQHLEGMATSFLSLVQSWSSLLPGETILGQKELRLLVERRVERAVAHSGILLQQLDFLLKGQAQGSMCESNVTYNRKVIYSVRSQIMAGIQAIKSYERDVFPTKHATWSLVDCLHSVSPANLHLILAGCLNHILQLYGSHSRSTWKDSGNIRSIWMSLIAQLPCVDNDLFIKTWKTFETEHYHIPDDLGSELLFSHMVSQGLIKKDIHWLRNVFEAHPQNASSKDYGSLLAALYSHEKHWSAAARYLIETLHELGRPNRILRALHAVRQHPKKTPLKLLRRTIISIGRINPRIALNLYKMYIPTRYHADEFDLSRCPQLIIAMIHDECIRPEQIWKLLNIPYYDRFQGQRPRLSEEPLSPSWRYLITNMATAFAFSNARPQRVALREVSQALYHLHRHKVPVSGKISQAVTRVGMTREVLRKNWIGSNRTRWIIDIVEQGEGAQVAKEVATLASAWNKKMDLDRTNMSCPGERRELERAASAY